MKPKIAIISFPMASPAPYYFLVDILKILDPITSNLFVITKNKSIIEDNAEVKFKLLDVKLNLHYAKNRKPVFMSYILWILKCIIIQLIISVKLLLIIRKVDIVLYMSSPYYLLPLLISKLFGKTNIEYLNRSKRAENNLFINYFFRLSDGLNFRLMDKIAPISKSIINDLKLNDRYSDKITEESMRFIESNNSIVDLKDRDKLVGYIARLKKEKGIVTFMKMVPLVLKENNNVSFFIAGSGDMSNWVKQEIKEIEQIYGKKITYIGWIPREEIYTYLSKLKILVSPTQSEAIGTINLEAMACGTPILVPPIGGLKDLIIDGYNGFIINEVSPESISKDVIKILNHSDLENIGENSLRLVLEQFSYEEVVKRWKIIIGEKTDFQKRLN